MPGLMEESSCDGAVVAGDNAPDSYKNGEIFNITPVDGARCTVIVEVNGGLYPKQCDIPLGEAFDTILGEPKTDIEDKLQSGLYGLHVGDLVEVSVDLDQLHKPEDCYTVKNNPERTHSDSDRERNTCDGLLSKESQDGSKYKEVVNLSPDDKKLFAKFLGFQNPPSVCDYTRLQKFEIAKFYKQAGVDLFISGKRKLAYRRFSKSLKFLLLMLPKREITSNMQGDYDQLRTQCYSNMAACLLKEGEYVLAVKNCTRSLDIDKKYVKSLYRRAEAYFHLQMFDKCRKDINAGLNLEPHNKAFLQLLKKVDN